MSWPTTITMAGWNELQSGWNASEQMAPNATTPFSPHGGLSPGQIGAITGGALGLCVCACLIPVAYHLARHYGPRYLGQRHSVTPTLSSIGSSPPRSPSDVAAYL